MSTGYHKITQFMIQNKKMAVFGRFEYLQVLKTLILQGELANLEEDIRKELGPKTIDLPRLTLNVGIELSGQGFGIELESQISQSNTDAESEASMDSDEENDADLVRRGIEPKRDVFFLQTMKSTEELWKNIVLANEKLDEYSE
jgi:hypothetical protein